MMNPWITTWIPIPKKTKQKRGRTKWRKKFLTPVFLVVEILQWSLEKNWLPSHI